MHNLQQLVTSVLEQGYLMSLATVDGGGVWVSDVIYIHPVTTWTPHPSGEGGGENPTSSLEAPACRPGCNGVHDDDLNIFWLSDPEVRHSRAILENQKVAATITVSNNAGEENIGLQIEGAAEKLEGNNLVLATQHRLKRKKNPPARDGEVEEGESWYRLQPTKIEIIHEPLFGFEKKGLGL